MLANPYTLVLGWRRRHKGNPPVKHDRAYLILHYCTLSLNYAGRMVYTESILGRQGLWRRKPGDFAGAAADCSQFVATVLKWCGVKSVSRWDATGSLWNKGKPIAKPAPAAVVIFGPYPGQHTGFITHRTKDGKDWYVVGFGWQGAPDRTTLSGNVSYFRERGFPGVRYLAFV